MTSVKKDIVKAGNEIYQEGLVAGTWGNISIRLENDENRFAITPSGMDYSEIDEEDIVIMDLDGEKVEGERKPSSEFRLHRHVYESRKDVDAIVHTHSVFASAVACARKSIPPLVEDMVQIVGGSVDTSEYRLPASDDLAEAAVEALGDKNGALLANHGVLAVGKDIDEAIKTSQIIEKSAKIFLFGKLIGGPTELSEEDVKTMRRMYTEDYGQD